MDRKRFKDLKEVDKIIIELEKLEYALSKEGFSSCKFYIDKPSRQLSVDFDILKPVLIDIVKDKLSFYKEVFKTL